MGCDDVSDCLDESDEDPYTCIMPWQPGIRSQCIVPAGQTCFPGGGPVHLIGEVTKVVDIKWLPQIVRLEGQMKYFYNETDGIQRSGGMNLFTTYFTASGKTVTKWGNDEYDFKAVAHVAYFMGSSRSYARIYSGVSQDYCGGCYFQPANA
ncbi:unnamed protein product [Owenia fusiformis]|uniref:Uncharacterized protein n=1 Tax=Owenia fusiformis TaxID=6347 RepID=A0A8J1TF23_OWEFU|nr:unnamed protein product [Owenia fusiformis]